MSYSLSELGVAFRKAKVDLYYSTNPSLFAIADYEENLDENLQRLLKKINGKPTTWVKDFGFLGAWTLAPKAIKCPKEKDAGLIHISPEDGRVSESKADVKWIHAKSGNQSYWIIVEISIVALRRFQFCRRSRIEAFKLVSDGFAPNISKDQNVLPKGGRNEPARKKRRGEVFLPGLCGGFFEDPGRGSCLLGQSAGDQSFSKSFI